MYINNFSLCRSFSFVSQCSHKIYAACSSAFAHHSTFFCFPIHNALFLAVFFMGNGKFMDRQIKKYNYKFTQTAAIHFMDRMLSLRISEHAYYSYCNYVHKCILMSLFTSTFCFLCSFFCKCYASRSTKSFLKF